MKKGVADQTSNRLTFEEIHEAARPEGRVSTFQILSAPRGIPIAFKGHYYGLGEGESLSPLNIHEIEQIRKQETREDWSAYGCQAVARDDLDSEAIHIRPARVQEEAS